MEKFEVVELPIDQIEIPKDRVSSYMDPEELKALEESISRFGIAFEPIVIEKDGKYILVAGKNRLETAKKLGHQKIRCKVFKGTEHEAILLHLAENAAKGRISALELYNYVVKLIEEKGMSVKDIARVTGLSESKIRTALQIGRLEDPIKEALMRDEIKEGHAKLLARIHDEEARKDVFEKILEYGLTVEEAEAYYKHGWLQECDMCHKQGVQLNKLFEGTPNEIFVCDECLKKYYPNIAKLKEAREEMLKKMLEEGEIPADISVDQFRCSMCKQLHPLAGQALVNYCKSCNAKLLRLLDQLEVNLGKKLHELKPEEIDRLVIKLV